MNEKPLYQHDCTECVFLGNMGHHDLYYHAESRWFPETVIARFSSDGPDYTSGMVFSHEYTDAITGEKWPGIPELVEARKRAERMGLRKTS